MKTRLLLILIVLIIIPVTFGIIYTIPNPIPHSTLEIHGMKDSYTVGEKYSFYYTLEGFGRTCHSATVSYPDYDGKIIGWGVDRDCNVEIQNKEFFYDSREHEFHYNSLVPRIPGIYKVSVHVENIQPAIFEFSVKTNPMENSSDINQQCADQFDKLLQEEKEHYVPCNSSIDDGNTAVCEPTSPGESIIRNDTFNQTGCPLIYKDWAYLTDDNDLVHGIYSPRYEFEMEKTNLDRHIPISIEKWGFDTCDSFYLRIINHDNRDEELSLMAYENICVSQSEQIKRQKFVYDLEHVELPFGNYVVYLYDDDPRNSNDIEHMQELTKFYFSSHYRTGPIIELDGIKQTNRSTLEITGRTNDVGSQIILNLYNPDGIFVTQDVLTPDSAGEFSTILTIGGPLFKLSGLYKITLQQGDVDVPQVNRIFNVVKENEN